jgi:outer membrane protein insertion porin family
MPVKKVLHVYYMTVVFIVASCTATRYLHEGEKLYAGGDIEIAASNRAKDLRHTLQSTVQPKPNYTFLGTRPKLWFYYLPGDSVTKGLGAWIRSTLGEPPVLMRGIKPDETARYLSAKLFNNGYFKGTTSYTIIEKGKTARVKYDCVTNELYTIKEMNYSIHDDSLRARIESLKSGSLIKPGDSYNLELMKKERERIDSTLRDNGYFYFNPDYLLFKAVINENDKTVSLFVCIKDDAPAKALKPYRIGVVDVDPDYSLRNDSTGRREGASMVNGVVFIRKSKIRPETIVRSIFVRKNDVYSRTWHAVTFNRLMTLQNFSFVNIKFTEADTGNPGVLNAHILLTPLPKRTLGSELMLVDKSNDFIGPRLNVNYHERNAFGGAELVTMNLDGSIETQFTGKYKNLYSYALNPQIEMNVPRMMIPFSLINQTGYFIPKTTLSLGYGFLKRIDYFDLKTLKFSYGYSWKDNIRKVHELDPVSVNYTSISNKTARFNALLDSVPLLKKSYEEQFITGSFYSFTFNEQAIPQQKSQFYLKATGELSGNALWLAQKIVLGKTGSAQNQQRIAGTVYSQFARATVDARNYFNFPDKSKLVLRLYCGMGKAYGNSTTLPYIRQFFSGGPSSVRAFQINSLGPGTYLQNSQKNSAYSEMGGDIKVEGNAEYRLNLIGILKGAIFIDAGNDWLLEQDTVIDSRPFALTRFYKELAVGTGIGLRADVSIFVLRLDLALPLRKSWLSENERWVVHAIDFGKYEWRRDNLVWNIAIGYPF